MAGRNIDTTSVLVFLKEDSVDERESPTHLPGPRTIFTSSHPDRFRRESLDSIINRQVWGNSNTYVWIVVSESCGVTSRSGWRRKNRLGVRVEATTSRRPESPSCDLFLHPNPPTLQPDTTGRFRSRLERPSRPRPYQGVYTGAVETGFSTSVHNLCKWNSRPRTRVTTFHLVHITWFQKKSLTTIFSGKGHRSRSRRDDPTSQEWRQQIVGIVFQNWS